jgi:5-methylthioribose kinase
MFELTSETAATYLRSTGRADLTEPIEVRELGGGVSNIVLRVSLPRREETYVIKQARTRLRVKEEWLCPAERIWHEVAALRYCSEKLAARSQGFLITDVPQLLWEDQVNFAYAMTSAPQEHKTWKELLLAGELASSRPLALACGSLLAQLHAGSWSAGAREMAAILLDRTYFVQLRVDPYYHHVARRHPDLAFALERLIDSVWQNRRCFVHGDYSPKNLLAWPGHVMLIDFEVGHFGDPAFDLGFFLTHLVCKSIWSGSGRREYVELAMAFWHSYCQTISAAVASDELTSLEQRTLWNLAGCLLARVDGKSPVDYLSPAQQQVARELARQWIVSPPPTWTEAAADVVVLG